MFKIGLYAIWIIQSIGCIVISIVSKAIQKISSPGHYDQKRNIAEGKWFR